MMNVLLIYPSVPTTFWSFEHALPFIGKKANLPPLGVLTVASLLPADWNLRLVDMNIERLTDRDIRWADLVLISAMVIQKDSAREVIDRCHALGKRIAAGGPLFTTESDCFDDVDHLLLYEGEMCVPEFVKDLEQGCAKHVYAPDGYPDLVHTPIPRWDLLKRKAYAMLSVQYSRGCPFHCEFCNIVSLFGHVPRTKSAAQVLAELDALFNMGWRGSVFFVDDNFIGNKNKLKNEILPAMIKWMRERDYPFAFFTEASINLSDDEKLMDLMVEAGFDNVFVGIETVDEESLSECQKVQNTKRDLLGCVRTIQEHGMQVQGGFILGFDSDKPSIFKLMIDFIQRSGIVTAMVGMLNAPRGTKLFERMQREGRLLTDFSGTNTELNFVTKMDMDELQNGYSQVVHAIYEPSNFTRRVKRFLEHFNPRKKKARRFTGRDVIAFLKTCLRLGTTPGPERRAFWDLMKWTLSTKRGQLAMAMTFAVYGYHFRRCLPPAPEGDS